MAKAFSPYLFLFWVLKVLAVQPMLIDRFDYPSDAALAGEWKSQNSESPAPTVVAGPEGKALARFALLFSTLTDWRVVWDREVNFDFSQHDRLKLRLRYLPGTAVAECIVYLKSGDGWYRLSGTDTRSGEWSTLIFPKDRAAIEDRPRGWHAIDRVRVAFTPAAKRDGHVELDRLEIIRGASLDDIASFGGFSGFEDAQAKLAAAAAGNPHESKIRERLATAVALRAEIAASSDSSEREVQRKIEQARRALAEAFAMTQSPRPGELRGFWGHYGDGIPGRGGRRERSWAEVIPILAQHGFNAVFPNMLWSGVAFYPSRVVPTAAVVAQKGDSLQACIAAARAHGVQVHVWKVSWQFAEGWLAPQGVSQPFREQGRLQVNLKGETVPWLCPSDPRNRQYELDAFLEAANYDVDGLHLDYIRYGGRDVCFCNGCRERFQRQTGVMVNRWPQDVSGNGLQAAAYDDWKREQITSFVRELRRALKDKKPSLKLSAAVFSHPENARNNVYQDWPRWIREGLLDFVCTMTYTESLSEFEGLVRAQIEAIGGKIPLYTGMFATFGSRRNQALEMQVEQILAARRLGANGFVLFELQEHLLDSLLPYLAAGLTRRE